LPETASLLVKKALPVRGTSDRSVAQPVEAGLELPSLTISAAPDGGTVSVNEERRVPPIVKLIGDPPSEMRSIVAVEVLSELFINMKEV
jgi:hypothetical protein